MYSKRGNTSNRAEKSQNGRVFPDYDQQKKVFRQKAYDIRNQHTKLHPIA